MYSYISVLEPSVQHEPAVQDAQGACVEGKHMPDTVLDRPSGQQTNHGNDAYIREPHLHRDIRARSNYLLAKFALVLTQTHNA